MASAAAAEDAGAQAHGAAIGTNDHRGRCGVPSYAVFPHAASWLIVGPSFSMRSL
jgi:hypothetical protein